MLKTCGTCLACRVLKWLGLDLSHALPFIGWVHWFYVGVFLSTTLWGKAPAWWEWLLFVALNALYLYEKRKGWI